MASSLVIEANLLPLRPFSNPACFLSLPSGVLHPGDIIGLALCSYLGNLVCVPFVFELSSGTKFPSLHFDWFWPQLS